LHFQTNKRSLAHFLHRSIRWKLMPPAIEGGPFNSWQNPNAAKILPASGTKITPVAYNSPHYGHCSRLANDHHSGEGCMLTVTRKNIETQRLMEIIQINGKMARDCTARECELIGEFYYKLAELQAIAEELRCPSPANMLKLVAAAYRAAEETNRIGGRDSLLSEIMYH
jgi:hypothetical protein